MIYAKILMVGSRNYNNYDRIFRMIGMYQEYYYDVHKLLISVITGDCKGADHFVKKACVTLSIPIKIYEADWIEDGRAAGAIRNNEMFSDLENSIVRQAVIFTNNINKSPGSLQTYNFCLKKHIPFDLINS